MERQRLDKWLWHARVVKARASAAALIEAGHVRVNGAREKAPGHSVKAGDVVTIGLDRTRADSEGSRFCRAARRRIRRARAVRRFAAKAGIDRKSTCVPASGSGMSDGDRLRHPQPAPAPDVPAQPD